ncbi:MAG: hypothetical protein H6624_03270 [Bdellovibrionaceae bacterium]|nr:hypothetical protein [Pseudobdellovibrionaceae bacterium]
MLRPFFRLGFALAGLFFWLGPVSAPVAVANDNDAPEFELGVIDLNGLERLFDSLEGRWNGRGLVTTGFGSGREESKTLRSRMRFDRHWRRDARWMWEEELERIEDRVTFTYNQAYFVRRDGLYLGGDMPNRRVDLVAANSGVVIFEYSWSNPPRRDYRREVKMQLSRSRGFDLQEKLYLRGQLLEVKQMHYQ